MIFYSTFSRVRAVPPCRTGVPFNVQLNYKIYNKNAVLREAYP